MKRQPSRYVSLPVRLTLIFLVIVLAGTLVQVLAISSVADRSFRRFVAEADRRMADRLAEYVAEVYEQAPNWPAVRRTLAMGMRMNVRERLLGDQPFLVTTPEGRPVLVPPDRLLDGREPPRTPPEPDKGVPISVDGTVVGRLFVGSMIGDGLSMQERAFLDGVRGTTVITGLVVAVVAAVAAALSAIQVTRPLRRLQAAAGAVAAGNFDLSLPVDRADEVGDLSRRFSDMARAVEANETFRRRMVADAAHELRTPVTVLSGSLEMLQEGVYEATPERLAELSEEVARLAGLVQELGRLSELESGSVSLNRDRLDLSDFLQRLLSRYSAAAGTVRLVYEPPPQAVHLRADADRISQVIYNLLSNAVRHSPSGGTVRVSLADGGDRVRIAVEDEGPGVPAELRERIFERFFRGDTSRTDTRNDDAGLGGAHYGLGLAISREIVHRHGGTLRVEDAPAGGARFVVELPNS